MNTYHDQLSSEDVSLSAGQNCALMYTHETYGHINKTNLSSSPAAHVFSDEGQHKSDAKTIAQPIT